MTVNELLARKKELERMLKRAEEDIMKAPEGNLRIQRKGKKNQYYQITEKGDNIGRYLKTFEFETARALAQKDYLEKLMVVAEREKKAIEVFLKNYAPKCPENTFESLNEYRRELVQPLAISDDEYAKAWESQPYSGKHFPDGYPEYYSKRGERVRSKTEENIANAFLELGVPYKYECPLQLDAGFFVYPDFTFLLKKSRKVCYLEHFGRMDDEEYLKNEFFTKMNSYPRNGLIPGVNFYMTFESKSNPLNSREISRYIRAVTREE